MWRRHLRAHISDGRRAAHAEYVLCEKQRCGAATGGHAQAMGSSSCLTYVLCKKGGFQRCGAATGGPAQAMGGSSWALGTPVIMPLCLCSIILTAAGTARAVATASKDALPCGFMGWMQLPIKHKGAPSDDPRCLYTGRVYS